VKVSVLSGPKNLLLILSLLACSALAAGQETILYHFKGGADGKNPVAGLITDKKGNLYGTTVGGGNGNQCQCGTVFEFTPRTNGGTKTILYNFLGGSDGGGPAASLAFDRSGNLYGTTADGGESNFGTVFQLQPPLKQGDAWTESLLYSFTNYNDGRYPSRLVIDQDGNLYGENPGEQGSNDYGYVFQLSPPTQGGAWNYRVLYSFRGGLSHDGNTPMGGLVLDKSGNLYGTTQFGGSENGCGGYGCGTVFELAHPAKQGGDWAEKVLYIFTGKPDGAEPLGGISFGPDSNGFYGTTLSGGTQSLGTVFHLAPPAHQGARWTETVLYSFISGSDTSGPNAAIVFDKAGNLYSTGTAGHGKSAGAVFELSPPAQAGGAWTEDVLWEGQFDAASTSGVILNQSDSALYGTLSRTGISNNGVLFRITSLKRKPWTRCATSE
jgi:uncharacterized repeat protein (TIGR03803 family)